MIARCDGRYPVPQTSPPRDEPFEVTYRCGLPRGHDGPHGSDRTDSAARPQTDRERAEQIARYETCGAPGYDGERCDKQLCVGCRELAETIAAFAATVRAEARQEERQRFKPLVAKWRERVVDQESGRVWLDLKACADELDAAIEAGEDGKP